MLNASQWLPTANFVVKKHIQGTTNYYLSLLIIHWDLKGLYMVAEGALTQCYPNRAQACFLVHLTSVSEGPGLVGEGAPEPDNEDPTLLLGDCFIWIYYSYIFLNERESL